MGKKLSLLAGVGAGFALWTIWQQHSRKNRARDWAAARPGTALVTGASAGIGAEFSRMLASQGYDLVLVARREERLRALAEEIQRLYPVKVEILTADLSQPEDLERTAARIEEIQDLNLLINNAGFGTGGNFAELDVRPELKMIDLHVRASVRLTRAALPAMIARQHGGVINVASVAGIAPMPGNTTYSATKAYLIHFSESVNAELAGTGVRVEALCPGFTYSEFHDVMEVDRSTIPDFLWMPASEVVAQALQGLKEGQGIVVTGAINRLLVWILMFPPLRGLILWLQSRPELKQWKGAR